MGFGDSIWEIFGPLLQGVPSVLIPDLILKDQRSLFAMLDKRRVTRIVLAPSLFHALLDVYSDLRERLPLLTFWVTSGEALPVELVHRFWQNAAMDLSPTTLLNLYGSSEVSADVAFYPTGHALPDAGVPIGKPIANTCLYIANHRLEPVPVGVPGYLYAGGVSLARGYHLRPDLTAERFIPNPFATEAKRSGSRLYHTGDLGRFLPNGNILYMGRADYQTKIRGYRIELGEIESTLLLAPGVVKAVVVVRRDPSRDAYLAAYVVAESGKQSHGALRSFLSEKLPSFMVPASLVFLTEMPLTPSGKIDRQMLPEPDFQAGLDSGEQGAPRSPVEEVLVEIFSEVLRLERVGIYDHFFELGGHSLMATQVLSRIVQAFGVEISLRQIFEEADRGRVGPPRHGRQTSFGRLGNAAASSFHQRTRSSPFLCSIAFVVPESLAARLFPLQSSRRGQDHGRRAGGSSGAESSNPCFPP